MKPLIALLTALTFMSASAFAHTFNENLTEARIYAALEAVKAEQNGRAEESWQPVIGKTIQVLGIGAAGTGAAGILIGSFALWCAKQGPTLGGEIVVAAGGFTIGGFLMTAGTVLAVIGTGLVALSPTPAHASTVQGYFLASPQNFMEFLNLPLEAQKQIVAVSPKLAAAMVGIADNLVH